MENNVFQRLYPESRARWGERAQGGHSPQLGLLQRPLADLLQGNSTTRTRFMRLGQAPGAQRFSGLFLKLLQARAGGGQKPPADEEPPDLLDMDFFARNAFWEQKKRSCVQIQRQEKAASEMEECNFKPRLSAASPPKLTIKHKERAPKALYKGPLSPVVQQISFTAGFNYEKFLRTVNP